MSDSNIDIRDAAPGSYELKGGKFRRIGPEFEDALVGGAHERTPEPGEHAAVEQAIRETGFFDDGGAPAEGDSTPSPRRRRAAEPSTPSSPSQTSTESTGDAASNTAGQE